VLASVVIKIEYCRALHRGSKELNRPGSLPCLPPACTPWRADNPPISGFPATKEPSVSNFSAAFLPGTGQQVECDVTHSKQTTATFLPGTRIAPRGLRQGTAFYAELRSTAVPSLVCPDEKRGIQLNYSFRAGSPAGAFACTLETPVCPGAFPTGLSGAFFAKDSVSLSPFLTGSAPQTELAVTHSKQTTGQFLIGAGMHIKEFANLHFSVPENLLLHPRPIQIFLRPTI
jgi:hypothetical protein